MKKKSISALSLFVATSLGVGGLSFSASEISSQTVSENGIQVVSQMTDTISDIESQLQSEVKNSETTISETPTIESEVNESEVVSDTTSVESEVDESEVVSETPTVDIEVNESEVTSDTSSAESEVITEEPKIDSDNDKGQAAVIDEQQPATVVTAPKAKSAVKAKSEKKGAHWVGNASKDKDGVNYYIDSHGLYERAVIWKDGHVSTRIIYSYSGGRNRQVDSKTFYNAKGERVKYENWSNGQLLDKITYKNGIVDKKWHYNSPRHYLYSFEKWEYGHRVQFNQYGINGVKTKSFYEDGKRVRFEQWSNGTRTRVVKYENGKVKTKYLYNKSGKLTERQGWKHGYLKERTIYNGSTAKKYLFTSKGRLYERRDYTNKKLALVTRYDASGKDSYTRYYYGNQKYGTRVYKHGVLVEKSDANFLRDKIDLDTPYTIYYYNMDGSLKKIEYMFKDGFWSVTDFYKNGKRIESVFNLGGHTTHTIEYSGSTQTIKLWPYCGGGGEPLWIQKSVNGKVVSSKQYDSYGNFKSNTKSYYGNPRSLDFIDFKVEQNLDKYDPGYDE